MPKRNRYQEAKRAGRRAMAQAERDRFRRDPANVLDDALWPPVAECGERHRGPCCWESVCCKGFDD